MSDEPAVPIRRIFGAPKGWLTGWLGGIAMVVVAGLVLWGILVRVAAGTDLSPATPPTVVATPAPAMPVPVPTTTSTTRSPSTIPPAITAPEPEPESDSSGPSGHGHSGEG